ncbi:hypothetical protein EVAR_78921_1 [Eumeta japonica]|uniref:Uncharacterized protein n=1 Tax=Eumeta variegata TaxID=151549 RepID=A0A4C1U2K3_EUMVA|nr:hypothetical protein EVAR_78921_1 [Eumeta japonica]
MSIPKRPLIRHPVPRLCMETNRAADHCRPALYGVRGPNMSSFLVKRVPIPPPVLPSKFLAVPASSRTTLAPPDVESSGMRRAISLSDLAARPTPAPRLPPQVAALHHSWTSATSGLRGLFLITCRQNFFVCEAPSGARPLAVADVADA